MTAIWRARKRLSTIMIITVILIDALNVKAEQINISSGYEMVNNVKILQELSGVGLIEGELAEGDQVEGKTAEDYLVDESESGEPSDKEPSKSEKDESEKDSSEKENLEKIESEKEELEKEESENEILVEEDKEDQEEDPDSDLEDETKKIPNTLLTMSQHNYEKESITGISGSKISVKELNKKLKAYGTLYGKGMPYAEYKAAMNQVWVDATVYNKKPETVKVDITENISYERYVKYLQKLSRYEDVYLYEIGQSSDGRILYSIEIDVESDYDKEVFLFTGQTHSREFAGGVFILKQFTDLVQKAQTDKKTMNMLKKYKYVAVPIISVDVREGLINNPFQWTTTYGALWKAYSDGTDGNRNYPAVSWGQLTKGNKFLSTISKVPSFGNYSGAYAGSSNETKAMMKWFYHYVVVEQAVYHMDYHQQGRLIYAGKPWQTKVQETRCVTFANQLAKLLNNSNRDKYCYLKENASYGLQGEGSTATDFTASLAAGGKFSPAYGFLTFSKGKKEYTLLEIKDLDKTKVEIKESNKKFATATIEIGYGTGYLGNSAKTRKLLAKEYNTYHYSKMLEALPGFLTVVRNSKDGLIN